MRSAFGCAGLGLLLLLVAGTFDAEPLYVTGSALALLGLGAAGWIAAGAYGAQIERELGGRSVLEEQSLAVVITARSGALPLPPGWIDEPLLPDPVRFQAGRRTTRVRVEMRFGRRGRRHLAPPALVLRDPFGLAQRVVRGEHEDEILVLPRTFPVKVTASGGEAMPAHARAALIAAAETEIDGVRQFREGTPASRIHWPSLARGHGLMERKLISESDSRPIVVLDPRAPASRDALDAAVRATGSLLLHFARRTGCALLLPGDRRAVYIEQDLLAWPQAHVRLALLDDSTGPALTAAQNRRGLVDLRLRPPGRPPAARARPHARRLPARLPGRAARPARGARGRRLSGLRRRAIRRRRRDGGGRGERDVSAAASGRVGPTPVAAENTLAVPAARALAFLALCGFATLQWMTMLEPAANQRAGYAVLAAGFAICGLLIAARLPVRARIPAAVLVAIAAFALALLGGGAADEQLMPDRWGELASTISRGISALPGARVPYRGLDESTRLVIGLGGTVLAVAAALLAFWPRRSELGLRNVALVLLVTLYAVPAVALDLSSEFLSGALLALLVVAYLRLERVQITDAGAAAMLAVAVTILGLAAAPALDTDEPWFDYETWALSSASSKSTSFSWDHSYGPLDWPRDGRELLRVKAKRPAYWKATNLDDFDGRRWVRDRSSTNLDGCDVSAYLSEGAEKNLQRIRVTVRNLRTQTFITAGVACAIDSPRLGSLPLGDGTYASMSRELRRGDAYGALVYTPNPNGAERRAAPRTYPATMQRYTRIELPQSLPPDPDPAAAVRLARLPGAVPDVRRARAPDDAVARRPGLGLRPGGTAPARGPLRAHLRARPGPQARRRHAGGVRAGGDAVPARRPVLLHRVAADRRREPRRLPVRRQVRLLPAVLGRDGAAAADGRRAGARLDRLHDRAAGPQGGGVRRARRRRPLVGRGLVRGLRLGDDGPDAGRRARALAVRRPERRPAPRRSAAPRTSAATSAPTRAAAWPRPTAGRRGR